MFCLESWVSCFPSEFFRRFWTYFVLCGMPMVRSPKRTKISRSFLGFCNSCLDSFSLLFDSHWLPLPFSSSKLFQATPLEEACHMILWLQAGTRLTKTRHAGPQHGELPSRTTCRKYFFGSKCPTNSGRNVVLDCLLTDKIGPSLQASLRELSSLSHPLPVLRPRCKHFPWHCV